MNDGPLAAMAGGPLRVLDLTGGIAGAYCTKLLADAGADVVKVEPEEGSPLRRWSATVDDLQEDGALFQFLSTSKRSVVGDPEGEDVRALAGVADLLVEDLHPGRCQAAGLLGIPSLVIVSISPYGRTGPWAGRPSADLVVQAESGCISGRGLPGGEPFSVGGRIFDFVAGSYAAAAGLAAVRTARRTGRGEQVDVSVTEAAAVASFACQAEITARLEGVTEATAAALPVQRVEVPSIEPTADGWVGFTTNSRQQLDDFLVLIERPDLIGDERFATAKSRWRHVDEWNAIAHAWTRRHATEEVISRAADLRIPVAPVATAETVQANPHFRARGVFQSNPSGGFPQPRSPYTISGVGRPDPRPVPGVGEHTGLVDWPTPPGRGRAPRSLPLVGVKVIDMTAWFAGPLAAHVLAALGADVIHVESARHMDGMRSTGGVVADRYPEWWECSSQFLSVNTDKRGLAVDLTTPWGRVVFERLVRSCDVLIENFTPRVMDNFGFTWPWLHGLNPQLIMVRMPAFGLDGPWRDRTGFAQTMEQVTGLAWVTGHRDDQPRIQRGPCDVVSGVHAVFSTLVALEARCARGEGVHVECTMVEAALNAAAEQIVEYGKYGVVMGREGNWSSSAAPQGLYRTSDQRWLAVSAETDEQWAALCPVLGRPTWGHDPALCTPAGRRRRRGEIDPAIARWAAGLEAAAAVDLLIERGVPAGIVADQRFLAGHPQFTARRFFEYLDHPVVGRQPLPGMPFRFSSVDHWLNRSAPTLGRDNREVLETVLGFTAHDVDRLLSEEVIGDRPAGL